VGAHLEALMDLRVGLVGIAGYGRSYLRGLLDDARLKDARLVAAADPNFQNCERLDDLKQRGLPIFTSSSEMFASTKLDLAIICSPIQFHARQVREALQAGAYVLCEKPLAGSLADAKQMLADSQSFGKFVSIGFQWSFTSAIQALKRDIREGVLGKPLRMRSLAVYPRGFEYYGRNAWAGKISTPTGQVLDSPVNNATAHFLHNMFFLLGDAPSTSQMPESVQAELYRANQIENFDTASLRCNIPGGTEVLFYTTHGISRTIGPRCIFEFENAVVSNEFDTEGNFIARFHNGGGRNYGNPQREDREKLFQTIRAIQTGEQVLCPVAAAMPHACTAIAASESSTIGVFPADLIDEIDGEQGPMLVVKGLEQATLNAFEKGVLYSELGDVQWAKPGKIVRISS
jgi:predicted dehydrogenase